MATAETTEVASKRRRSSEEKDSGHASGKKSKGSSSESGRKSKRRKKEKEREGSLRVRSISELARLVSSGAIRVPKSLINYADDRTQLMDQVFTILSPDDIKGMLPDILKGLRMKQVKQLCYEQLKNMTIAAIKETIEPEDTDLETGLNTVLSELIGKTRESRGILQGSLADSETSRGDSAEKCSPSSGEVTAGSSVPPTKTVPPAKSGTCTPVKEIVIRVSDVSGSESEDEMKRGKGGRRHSCSQLDADHAKSVLALGLEASDNPMELSSSAAAAIETEDEIEIHAVDTTIDETGFEFGSQRGVHAGNLSGENPQSDSDGLSEAEDDWDSSIPEAAVLLEMELRKRALESELRRTGTHGSSEQDTGTDSALHASVAACCENSGIMDSWDDPTEGDGLDKAQLLELKLRQKALQSLLAKRKQSQS